MKQLWRWWLRSLAAVASLLGMKRRVLELSQQIRALSPKDGRAAAAVASLLVEEGQPAAAADVMRQVLEHDTRYADGWFNLGYIEELRGANGEAERCFRRALELNAKHDRAWYGLALALIREGRLREAVDALKENTRLQPFSPYGFYQLAMTHHHLGEDSAAWQIHGHLKGFEPRYAAALKRDLENTKPSARAEAVPDSPTSTATEALTAST